MESTDPFEAGFCHYGSCEAVVGAGNGLAEGNALPLELADADFASGWSSKLRTGGFAAVEWAPSFVVTTPTVPLVDVDSNWFPSAEQ